MNLLALIPEFLRSIGAILPTLTMLSASPGWISLAEQVLSAGATLVERGEEGASELQALTQHIQSLQGTDASSGDWDALRARSDAAHAILQAPPAGSAA